jgi:hypothetical protein
LTTVSILRPDRSTVAEGEGDHSDQGDADNEGFPHAGASPSDKHLLLGPAAKGFLGRHH